SFSGPLVAYAVFGRLQPHISTVTIGLHRERQVTAVEVVHPIQRVEQRIEENRVSIRLVFAGGVVLPCRNFVFEECKRSRKEHHVKHSCDENTTDGVGVEINVISPKVHWSLSTKKRNTKNEGQQGINQPDFPDLIHQKREKQQHRP